MKLKSRPARLDDFNAFFDAFYSRSPELIAILRYEWALFLAQARDLTMVVEDQERMPGDRMVGVAQTVFVTDAFVAYAHSGLPPHINLHASLPLPDGSSAILTPDQIRVANSSGGLNALTTRWAWRDNIGDMETTREVRAFLDRTYSLYWRGYKYKSLMIGAYGFWPYEGLLRAGYSLVSDYSDYYQANPPAPAPDERPYLLFAGREGAGSTEGSYVSHIFDYSPPRFGFRAHEQELLWAALIGLNESETRNRLSVGPDALKKRWESIYERVRAVDPLVIPEGGEQTRGAEKRWLLLAYLRDHMEEIRPHNPPGG